MKKKRRKQQIDGKNKLFQIFDSIKRDIDAILAVLCFDFFFLTVEILMLFELISISQMLLEMSIFVIFCRFLSVFV